MISACFLIQHFKKSFHYSSVLQTEYNEKQNKNLPIILGNKRDGDLGVGALWNRIARETSLGRCCLNKDLTQRKEWVTHESRSLGVKTSMVWSGSSKRPLDSRRQVMGSLPGHGRDFGVFCTHNEKPSEGFEGRMTWSGYILKRIILAALREERL